MSPMIASHCSRSTSANQLVLHASAAADLQIVAILSVTCVLNLTNVNNCPLEMTHLTCVSISKVGARANRINGPG
jgi:hypothetical protein